MKTLNMQQLCSFAQDDQKIEGKFALLTVNDSAMLHKFRVIGCRIMLLVFSGSMEAEVNGKNVVMERCDFLDILEGTSFSLSSGSPDLDFYCVLTSREFIVEVLQNIVPGPKDYFSLLLVNPVLRLSANATAKLFKQLRLVDDVLSDLGHNYRTEMVRTYFKGFALELGNLLIREQHLPVLDKQTLDGDATSARVSGLQYKSGYKFGYNLVSYYDNYGDVYVSDPSETQYVDLVATGINSVETEKAEAEQPIEIYDLSGRKVGKAAAKGVYIIKSGGKAKKVRF